MLYPVFKHRNRSSLAYLTALTCLTAVLALLQAPFIALAGPPDPVAEARPRVGPIQGTLVIVGGGSLPETIRNRFLDLAGGKEARLVVIPTACAKPDQPDLIQRCYRFWEQQDVASVEMVHTFDPEQANNPEFVQPLTKATAVWLSGGDQSRLVDAYRGTAVEKELRKVLARGGVIGGTSAGAAAMSSVMIRGGNPMAQIGNGFGFLPNVVIDQHFQNRNRLQRLLGVLTRHPDNFGLGIDEETAVVVTGRTATVVGKANVRVCQSDPEPESPAIQVLKDGDELDLVDLGQTTMQRSRSASVPKRRSDEGPEPARSADK